MAAKSFGKRITLLSFRTFGDYVLKAPFLHEVYRRYPDAEVTLLTNKKGGEVYPLLDSRLKVVIADHGEGKAQILRRVLRIPRADLVYAMDDSQTTLILSLLARGKRKIGWVQGISRLYAKDGYFEWKSVRPWLSSVVKHRFHPGMVRLPEDKYDGYVELELLESGPPEERRPMPLAAYRSDFACPPASRPETPFIYCAAEAGWVARQLTDEQWQGVITGLLAAFPRHRIVVHGADAAAMNMGERVICSGKGSIRELFQRVSSADMVIAPDSFALHLASFYDVPAIGYFGPAKPHRFRPTGPGSSTLFRDPGCSPCLQGRGTLACARGFTQCLSLAQLTPRDFVEAAKGILGDNGN